jgi:putative redox protein
MTISARAAAASSLVDISAGTARWHADLAAANCGSGLHPSPHDLLDSALAACTVLTVQLYAKRKDYPLEAVSAQVDREQAGPVYRMRRRLALTGPLTPEQRSNLLRVANACPVHKTLSGTIELATELVD